MRVPAPRSIEYIPPVRSIPQDYQEARDLADKARAKAYKRVDELTAQLKDQEQRGVRNFAPYTAEEVASQWLIKDPAFLAAVADNKWYLEYAQAYGIGEILRELRRPIRLQAGPGLAEAYRSMQRLQQSAPDQRQGD